MIVAAFAGTGKTYFAYHHPDIAVDFVLTPYKYIRQAYYIKTETIFKRCFGYKGNIVT